jgi:hypothetical protein
MTVHGCSLSVTTSGAEADQVTTGARQRTRARPRRRASPSLRPSQDKCGRDARFCMSRCEDVQVTTSRRRRSLALACSASLRNCHSAVVGASGRGHEASGRERKAWPATAQSYLLGSSVSVSPDESGNSPFLTMTTMLCLNPRPHNSMQRSSDCFSVHSPLFISVHERRKARRKLARGLS